MLELVNIHKAFGENHVLSGTNLFFKKGNIYTIVGGNGSGKSTIFNIITGFLKSDSGEIYYNRKRISNTSPIIINHLGITRTFQDVRLISDLSVLDNILLAFKNNPGENILKAILPSQFFKSQYIKYVKEAEMIIEKIHLIDHKNILAKELSFGQQKLLSIGCCVANGADVLLLDEPVSGIDEENYLRIFNLIIELKKENKTIVQIEHNHKFIKNLSDGIYFLYNGKSNYFENYDLFINNEIVKKVYLK